jgi:hypothetical protein
MWDAYRGVVLLITIVAFCTPVISQADSLHFKQGTVVPIATLVDFDPEESVPKPQGVHDQYHDYHFRYIELLDPTTLRLTAAYRGDRSSRDTHFLIDLKEVGSFLGRKRPPPHLFTLYQGYLEDGDSECHDYWKEFQEISRFAKTVQTFNGFVSTERYEVDVDCTRLLAVAEYVKEVMPIEDSVSYDKSRRSIDLTVGGNTVQYPLKVDSGLEIAHKGLGVVGKHYSTSPDIKIVSLEIKNSFFAVFALEDGKSSRLLLGPGQTSSNRGFVPRSLSVAPDRKPWMAYIGPQGENGLWGISVWDIGQGTKPRQISSLATGKLAYSEHRGFDHAVSWTGPDSLIYLEDDELTLTHVRVKADGSNQIIGQYAFSKGDAFSSIGKVFDTSWEHEFTLFRLEAISALPIDGGHSVRVACVAVLSYQSEEGDGQVALPLIVDLSWDLKGKG